MLHFILRIVTIGATYEKRGRKMEQTPKKQRKDFRLEREAKALQKNLKKRKAQQKAREQLKQLKETKNGQD